MLNIFDSNKLKIRQRLTRLLLSTNLATLLVVGVIAVVGMMNNIDLADDVGIKIGHQSSENSSEALRNQKQLELLENARDIAGDVRYKLTIIIVFNLQDYIRPVFSVPYFRLLFLSLSVHSFLDHIHFFHWIDLGCNTCFDHIPTYPVVPFPVDSLCYSDCNYNPYFSP